METTAVRTVIPESPTATDERDGAAGADIDVELRPIELADVEPVSRIVYEAFAGIADRHGFPRDFPTVDAARGLVTAFTSHPSIWGVVAERDGRVLGSNFLDERGRVRGVGPITVDPHTQQRGVGRRLMAAVLERSAGAAGVRLLQDSFDVRSLGLYASLGFRATDPASAPAMAALITGAIATSERRRPQGAWIPSVL
jgi:predicted N-acetyltransferase YhbS